MAEALAIVGIVSSIVQLVDFGTKIIRRLQDFQSSINSVPKAFRDIKIELPLLLDTLKRTQGQAESGGISRDTQNALLPVVEGCRVQVELLEGILVKTLPKAGDSSLRRGVLALSSLGQEKEVEEITSTLRKYVQTLTYHQATGPAPMVVRKPVKAAFMLPFDRDSDFVGREDILEEIETRFKNRRRVALAGIGGVGKSQIAIEYCYRWHKQHPQGHVMWIHASSPGKLEEAYNRIASKLCMPGCDDPDADILELVCEWLSDAEHGEWLLAIDNADDMSTFFNPSEPLQKFLPRSPKGSILITTRDKRIGDRLADRAKTILVLPMNHKEAENLLRLTVPDESGSETDEANDLLDALGYLPLAITQAAAFINENCMTVSEYLEAFRTDDSEVQELLLQDLGDSRRDSDIQNSIIRTWKLSFDLISKQKPRAAELLSLMCILDRQGIPKTLLKKDDESGVEFATALGTLQAFSLISVEKGGTSCEMHRLVQLSTQSWLELKGSKEKWQTAALELLSEKYPDGEYENWPECALLMPHALAVTAAAASANSQSLVYTDLLSKIAWYDYTTGHYEAAVKKYKVVLKITEDVLGADHIDRREKLIDLGIVYDRQEKYDDSEALFRQAWELNLKELGKEHPDTLRSVFYLALALKGQEKTAEAEVLLRELLKLQEEIRGKEHADTLLTMHSLAMALHEQEKCDEAKSILRPAIELHKKVFGKEHPLTLTSIHNLGHILQADKEYEEAEQLYRQSWEAEAKVLGKDHPYTLLTASCLAEVLQRTGRFDEAEGIYRDTYEGFVKAFGREHASTVGCKKDLESLIKEREESLKPKEEEEKEGKEDDVVSVMEGESEVMDLREKLHKVSLRSRPETRALMSLMKWKGISKQQGGLEVWKGVSSQHVVEVSES